MRKIVVLIMLFGALFLGAIDLQTASKSELMSIKGIGDKKADSIIEYRKSNTISKPDDLRNIKGFGDSIINNIKNYMENNNN
ncbi:helix-hairpin-helix domain-containing protein [Aliarcobacter thereius]|uniref:Helix-hairpin-helix domain-containing protein n=1 Tax=Aliarcobacter thereius TaxID=544718 RepID=A0A5R9GXW0_9BACT|nr:helix-hairpin-helix domain-containing protein [Aliarcobacter thereius]TLS71586.1 helix-hairpin-helix domain-containing protein [Aliarcobacter thereius]